MALILFVVLGGRELMSGGSTPTTPDGSRHGRTAAARCGPRGGARARRCATRTRRRGVPPGPESSRSIAFVGVALVALIFDRNIGFTAITAAVVLADAVARAAEGRGQADRLADRAAGRRCQHVRDDPGPPRARREYVGNWAAGLGAAAIGALILCYVGGVVSAFASSTALLPVIIPIAIPLIDEGGHQRRAFVAALAVSSTIVDVSPFSTNGALMLANRPETICEQEYYKQILTYSVIIVRGRPAARLGRPRAARLVTLPSSGAAPGRGAGDRAPLACGAMGLLLQTPRARARRVLRRLTGDGSSPLAGRTVLVTGASSGIGEATARAVAGRGATVLLVARRADELDRVRAAIEAAGGRAAAYPCDLTDGDAVDALVARVLADHGAVDYLVNNAGRSIRRSLHLSHDRFHDFERTMAVNYFGPVRLTMGLLPAMRAQRFGHVVNIVTWGVQMKAPKFAAYIASKAALDTWSPDRVAGGVRRQRHVHEHALLAGADADGRADRGVRRPPRRHPRAGRRAGRARARGPPGHRERAGRQRRRGRSTWSRPGWATACSGASTGRPRTRAAARATPPSRPDPSR